MKSNYWLLTVIFALVALPGKAGEWIRINQLGYLPQSVKVAVFMSEEGTNVENYSLIDAFTGNTDLPAYADVENDRFRSG